MTNAKAIRRLVQAVLAVCILFLAQAASAEEVKHSVTLPKTASEWEDYWYFIDDESITDVFVEEGNEEFCSIDGVLFTKDRKTLIACPRGKQGEYEIPDGTEEIGMRAFFQNNGLTYVFVPDSVQVIGIEAFAETETIRKIRLPEKMKYIDCNAFRDNWALEELKLPEGPTEIMPGMLEGNTRLQGTLRIPESVTKIRDEALCFLYRVSDIYWPDHDIRFTLCLGGEEEDLEDKADIFGWNDCGIADFTVVMHAHEGTPAAEWVKSYPHVLSPQGVETMDAAGYAEMCTRVMRESGYPEAEICCNPDLKWMAVKPLVAYNLDHAVAVFRNSGKTLLCGFEALNGEWELQWVNEQFLEVSSLPVLLAYFGEDYLRIILPDPSDPDVDNAVDYWFDARTLTLVKATYVTGYLWYDNEDVWNCRVEGGKLVYSYAEHMERDEEGNWVEVEEEEFSTVDANEEDLVLSTGKRLPVYPKGYKENTGE